MQLMKRDISILTNLSNAPHSSSQIALEFFNSNRTNANRRMRKLMAAGLVDCAAIPSLKAGRCEYAYHLFKKAPRLLKRGHGIVVKAKSIKYAALRHALALNDIRIAFKFALSTSEQHHAKFVYSPVFDAIIPDGMLIVRHNKSKRTTILFLEVDLSSEPLHVLQAKVYSYQHLVDSEEVKAHFSFLVHRFIVLFTANSSHRVQRICELFDTDIFLCTELGNITDADSLLAAPIWRGKCLQTISLGGVL